MDLNNSAVTKEVKTMARKQSRNFSFSDNDLQSFVKQYKVTAAKEMVPSLHSVDERLD